MVTHDPQTTQPPPAQTITAARHETSLSDQEISRIAWAASDGTADPDEVCELLAIFYEFALSNRPVPRRLIDFVAASFGRYLRSKKEYGHLKSKEFFGPEERIASSLDAAFGVKKRRGRHGGAGLATLQHVAAAVWKLRLVGESHQTALFEVSEQIRRGETLVSSAWRDHKLSGLLLLRNERSSDAYPWTPAEEQIIQGIIGDRITSEKLPNKSK